MYKLAILFLVSMAFPGFAYSAMKGRVVDDGYHGAMVLKKNAEQKDWLLADRLMTAVRSASSLMQSKKLSDSQKREATTIYASTWASALTVTSSFHTPKAKAHVLKQWKSDLSHHPNLPAMAWAMAITGADEEYFTSDLKRAFSQTSNTSVLKSLSFWIARWGNDDDVALMEKRARTIKSENLKNILLVALRWRNLGKSRQENDRLQGAAAYSGGPEPGDPLAPGPK